MINNWFLGMGIVMLFLVVLMIAVPIMAVIVWIVMLVDCLQRKFRDKDDKIIWVVVLVFLNIVGAVIYYFLIKRKYRHR